MKTVAIIPARGGSTRLFRKNIRHIWGKPMIYWVIKAAERSKYITRLMSLLRRILPKDLLVKTQMQLDSYQRYHEQYQERSDISIEMEDYFLLQVLSKS